MKIRFAAINDLQDIDRIYNQAIFSGKATADIRPLAARDRRSWFLDHSEKTYPVYVAEIEGRVIGWSSLSPYRKGREGLKSTAEITYYIDYDFHGEGYGERLIKHMILDCKRLGIKHLVALLLDINTASIAILEKFGFARWGLLPNVVDLNEVICSHVIYGKNL